MARKALVVGVSVYDDRGITALKYAEQDALRVGEVLSRGGFKVSSLVGPAASRRAVNAAILALTKDLTKADCFLFYFAGHGVEQGDEQLLLAHDARLEELRSGAAADVIPLLGLEKMTSRAGASRIICIDACRAPLTSDRSVAATLGLSHVRMLEALTKKSNGRPPLAILRACDAAQASYEIDDLDVAGGAFTVALIRELEERLTAGTSFEIPRDMEGLTRRCQQLLTDYRPGAQQDPGCHSNRGRVVLLEARGRVIQEAKASSELMSGSRLVNRYVIQRQLAASVHNNVYLARDEFLECDVAVKAFPSDSQEDAKNRLRAEVAAATRLSHPNILRVNQCEEYPVAFFVMEYVPGETLASKLARERRIDAVEAVRIAKCLLSALTYAHGQGTVHGNIVASKILLGADRSVKLGGFGAPRPSRDSGLQGPAPTDSDLRAVGVLTFQMLTGDARVPEGRSRVAASIAANRVQAEAAEFALTLLDNETGRTQSEIQQLLLDNAPPSSEGANVPTSKRPPMSKAIFDNDAIRVATYVLSIATVVGGYSWWASSQLSQWWWFGLPIALLVGAMLPRPIVNPRLYDPETVKEALGLDLLEAVFPPDVSPLLWQLSRAQINFRMLKPGVGEVEDRRISCVTGPSIRVNTIVGAALAASLARAGQRVLLIDSALAQPELHRLLKTAAEPGLSDLIVADAKASEVVKRAQVPNLWFITGGKVPPNPTELLGSRRMWDFLGSLGEHFDCVLLIGAPVDTAEGYQSLLCASNTILALDDYSSLRTTARREARKLRDLPIGGVIILRKSLGTADKYPGDPDS